MVIRRPAESTIDFIIQVMDDSTIDTTTDVPVYNNKKRKQHFSFKEASPKPASQSNRERALQSLTLPFAHPSPPPLKKYKQSFKIPKITAKTEGTISFDTKTKKSSTLTTHEISSTNAYLLPSNIQEPLIASTSRISIESRLLKLEQYNSTLQATSKPTIPSIFYELKRLQTDTQEHLLRIEEKLNTLTNKLYIM